MGVHQVFALVVVAMVYVTFAAWQENLRPKMYVELGIKDDVHRFYGNDSHTDYFRLVMRDDDWLIVSGRNLVYNLSMTDLKEQQRLAWYSNDADVKMCLMKGKDDENCQNYIKIMAKTSSGRLLLCGTNSFKPLCREYNILSGNYSMDKEKPGQAVCPYDPRHNSTSIYVDGDLYTGTVADFSGMDPIIYREPLQTEQYDSMSLNAPDFVNSLTQGDFVYFFFRETAVEYINCGKAVYSRVARVCKYDRGGPHRFRNRWTSFLKSRLNCSVTGDFPFYFNEIQSSTDLIEGRYGSDTTPHQLIYGTFTTPANSITGSAVCAFSLQDIADTFEGSFKEQQALNSNWLPVQSGKVPDPRPGQCHNDSRTLPDLTLNFIKTHSLMDESVPSFFGAPIVIRTTVHYRFTQIAVDPQVKVPGGKTYDVLFIGTDTGKVIKAVNAMSADSRHGVRPVVIEEIQVFAGHVPVRGLHVLHSSSSSGGNTGKMQEGRLIVVADGEVQSLKLHRCDSNKISSCSECVALQDPYCAWDKLQGKCRSPVGAARWADEAVFFQHVASGQHTACPPLLKSLSSNSGNGGGGGGGMGLGLGGGGGAGGGRESSLGGLSSSQGMNGGKGGDREQGQVINIINTKYGDGGEGGEGGEHRQYPGVSAAESMPPQYSVETLVMAVLAGALAALVVGFVAGYVCGRKCHKDEDDNMPYPDTEYEYFEQRQNMNRFRIAAEPKLLPQEEVTYAEPVLAPQPPPKLMQHSPKGTLRKLPPPGAMGQMGGGGGGGLGPAETLFQFQDTMGGGGGGYNGGGREYRTNRADREGRGGDGFGTLRSHQSHLGDGTATNYRNRERGGDRCAPGPPLPNCNDGFATTRSVKKVYL